MLSGTAASSLPCLPQSSPCLTEPTTPAPGPDHPRPTQPSSTPRSAKKSGGEEPKVPRKNRLQEEHSKMLSIESNLVRRQVHAQGPAGFGYKCLRCGIIKFGRLRAIGHAANCGRKKSCKRRGKSKNSLKCNICQVTATTVKELSKHRREKHASVLEKAAFKCTRCRKTFAYSQNYKKHMALHLLGRGRFSCDICPQKFSFLRNLKRHRLLSHLTEMRGFPCSTCGKKYSRLDSLKRHLLQAHKAPGLKVKCTRCSLVFSRTDSLRRHMNKVHLVVGGNPFSVEDGNQVECRGDHLEEVVQVLKARGYSRE